MPSIVQVDACGRRRSPATLSSFHQGRPPRNKGQRYPADPPTVEEIIAVMRSAGEDNQAVRLRGLIVVLWRAGLRISEALALSEGDLDLTRGAILVCRGKGGKRREVGMDRWAWEQLSPWLRLRATLPVGALFCVHARPDRRPRVGARRCPISAAPSRRPGRGATSLRATPAQTRPRRGDVARGGAVARHPAPTRPRRPRDHLGLLARDR
jgi:integrase